MSEPSALPAHASHCAAAPTAAERIVRTALPTGTCSAAETHQSIYSFRLPCARTPSPVMTSARLRSSAPRHCYVSYGGAACAAARPVCREIKGFTGVCCVGLDRTWLQNSIAITCTFGLRGSARSRRTIFGCCIVACDAISFSKVTARILARSTIFSATGCAVRTCLAFHTTAKVPDPIGRMATKSPNKQPGWSPPRHMVSAPCACATKLVQRRGV